MAGHSKWANIKHRKTLQDKKKSKLFSKLINNIKGSLKNGKDTQYNYKLKNAVTQALDNNISKSTIKNIIQKTENNVQKPHILYFKNDDNIIFIITVQNDTKAISDIRYIFNNAFFNNISAEKINQSQQIYEKLIILDNYNEMHIFNKIKLFSIKDFIDSSIITHSNVLNEIKTIINPINTKNSIFIEFKEHVKLDIKAKQKILTLYKKLLQNVNIENVFINITLQ